MSSVPALTNPQGPGAVTTQNFSERTRNLLTLLNLHYAALAALALLNAYLLTHMALSYRATGSQNQQALAQQALTMRTAELQAKPLQGLDAKLLLSNAEANSFYLQRLPSSYSQVAGELGAVARRENVRLTRVQYAPAPVLEADGPPISLTAVRMDASLSGDYRPLVEFVNALERDRMFFVISNLTLTGQQSGAVGLRLRLTTYLRAPVGAESAAPLPTPNPDDASAPGTPQ